MAAGRLFAPSVPDRAAFKLLATWATEAHEHYARPHDTEATDLRDRLVAFAADPTKRNARTLEGARVRIAGLRFPARPYPHWQSNRALGFLNVAASVSYVFFDVGWVTVSNVLQLAAAEMVLVRTEADDTLSEFEADAQVRTELAATLNEATSS